MPAHVFAFPDRETVYWYRHVFDLREPEFASSATFHKHLGSMEQFWRDWSGPAEELQLKLLQAVELEETYDWGLFCGGECIDGLEEELSVLEEYWRITESDRQLYDELRQQLGAVREAIRVARDIQGILILILWE